MNVLKSLILTALIVACVVCYCQFQKIADLKAEIDW